MTVTPPPDGLPPDEPPADGLPALSAKLLPEVFPFLLVLSRELRLVGHGPALSKVVKDLQPGAPLSSLFTLTRPRVPLTFENLRRTAKNTVYLASVSSQVRMRGQLLYDADTDRLLFLGAPWFTDLEDLERSGLVLSDFTIHDPIVDFLYLVRAQKLATEDARKLGEEAARRRDELEASNRRLEEASRAKTQFLANTSHELRTPLNGIMGMASLLVRQDLPPQSQRFAESILRSARSLLNVVNDILDISKIEAGKLTLSEVPFDLPRLLTEVIEGHSVAANSKGLELCCRHGTELPSGLRGDPQRLRQILDNLLGNAIKFTAQGEVVLSVSLVDQSVGRIVVRFEVRDTGIGIAPADQQRLFQVFSQIDSGMSRQFGGTGLGLALCKELAALMNGEIGVHSESGAGSTFWFTAQLGVGSRPEFLLGGREQLGHLRSLVVDDNTTNREYLGTLLGQWGMHADTADNALRALELLRSAQARGEPYDVVLIDQQMPGMTGLDLATVLSADRAFENLVLLLLSSVDLQTVNEHPGSTRLHAVLPKPVSPSSLLDCLVQLVNPGAHPEPGGRTPRPSASSLPGRLSTAGAQILVVDDNPVNIEVAVRMAESMGYRADSASGGREALQALAQRSYELVLMDLQMPGIDGYQATAEIRRREGSERHTPIVAVTAHAMPEDHERALSRGFDDYLPKPVDYDVMAACLQRWIVPPSPEPAAVPPPPAPALDAESPDVESPDAEPPLDAEVLAGLRRLSRPGEEDFMATVLQKFRGTLPGLRKALQGALAAQDREAFGRAAHKLKSASAHVGAQRLTRLCATAQKAPTTSEPLGPLGRELLAELGRVEPYVDKLLQGAAARP
ncbi:MAG: response regulator [Polyangia bacterium]